MAMAYQEKHLEMGTMTISNTAIAITNGSLAFTAANLAAADVAYISAATGDLRVLCTGDDPTATVGIPVTAGGLTVIEGNAAINALKMIRQSVDAVVTIVLTTKV